MKQLFNELRIYLAEKLLYLGMKISPDNIQGETFVRSGLGYFEKAILNNVNNGE